MQDSGYHMKNQRRPMGYHVKTSRPYIKRMRKSLPILNPTSSKPNRREICVGYSCSFLLSSLLLMSLAAQPGYAYISDESQRNHTPEYLEDERGYEPDYFVPRFESEEQRLMRNLVGYYDSSVRPVYDAMTAVDVKLGLTLTQILDLDEKNQVLTTNVWLEAEWFDERLNWSASEYGGISSIRIPCHKLWLPDIVLYNSVDDYTSGYMPSLAMVYNNSRVFWGPVIRFRSSCKIDITFFPFDTQVCKLKMGSWAYTGLQVNVWNRSNTMDLLNFVDNGEWELLGVAVERNVVYYNCCVEPFPDVTFRVQLRRRTIYYFMNIIIPCIILSFLCLGGFLLPPESGEKITLGLSVLLTITVFMLMVADKMPQTSESVSVISIYLMVVLATSCLSVLSSVLVLSLHHQRSRPSRAPLWLRKFCFGFVTPLFCLQRRHFVQQPGDIVVQSNRQKPGATSRKESRFRTGGKIASSEEECEYLRMDHTREVEQDDNKEMNSSRTESAKISPKIHACHQVYTPRLQQADAFPNAHHHAYTPFQQQQQQHFASSHHLPQHSAKRKGLQGNPEDSEILHSDSAFCNETDGVSSGPVCDDEEGNFDYMLEEERVPVTGKGGYAYSVVVKYLISLIQTRQEDEVRDEELFQEWRDIAHVIDRLLFFLFFTVTLLCTVCILEMRPAVEKL